MARRRNMKLFNVVVACGAGGGADPAGAEHPLQLRQSGLDADDRPLAPRRAGGADLDTDRSHVADAGAYRDRLGRCGFCRHWGVDLGEIRAAIAKADDDLDEARGASTIPMQVAKNLFLWPGRSFIRKGLELPLALWIDLVLSKRRLMEIYLNIAEWGPDGEFGVEAGAQRALRKSAAQVSASEAALLAVMHAQTPSSVMPAVRPRACAGSRPGWMGGIEQEGPEIVSCLHLAR